MVGSTSRSWPTLRSARGPDATSELRADLTNREWVAEPTIPDAPGARADADPADYFFAAGHLLDAVPNPWGGRDLVRRALEAASVAPLGCVRLRFAPPTDKRAR